MSAIELTSSQRKILQALTNLYNERDGAIKGELIAERVERNPGTIRNQMQSLKALQLVEGVPGPKGGYKPTAKAFSTLDIQKIDSEAAVPIMRNGDPIPDANVEEIDLNSVHHPDLCQAEIHFRGPIGDFKEGDSVTVGPTPLSKLLLRGTVTGKDDSKNILILDIATMEAPAEST